MPICFCGHDEDEHAPWPSRACEACDDCACFEEEEEEEEEEEDE